MPHGKQSAGWRRLGAALVAIAGIWGVALPRLEQTAAVQSRIKHLDTHGIDAAAFFYSDHPGMKRWERQVREALPPDRRGVW